MRPISLMLAAAIIVVALPVRADGLPPRPHPLPETLGHPGARVPQPSQSCLMTALQMAYLTGRREVGYANTEACMLFAGSRGAVLPYGPSGYFVPPGWLVPVPPPRPY
jgi:hypothetical protein